MLHICFFIFDLVTGPFQADWLWRDGRVRTSEGAPLLRHYLLEWPTHTDTSQAYSLPASHVWGWWGLLRKRKIFQYSSGFSIFIHSLLKCYALLKDFPTIWSNTNPLPTITVLTYPRLVFYLSTMTSWASSATCRWPNPAHHTPCRHMNRHLHRDPAATLSSTSTT